MKPVLFILAVILLPLQSIIAQPPVGSTIKMTVLHNELHTGPAIPIASFSETHSGGITVSYMRSMDRISTREPFKLKKYGWIMATSLSHFIGRKETIGMASFRYKGYSLLDLQGGMAWYPNEKIRFSLCTGPGLGYYQKSFRFTVTGWLQGSYMISPKTNITPGLSFINESGSDALWVTSLQLGYIF